MSDRITAIVLTLNEESRIVRCIDSLRWVDRVIVVDARSTDATVALAESLGAEVVVRPMASFAEQRNFAARLVEEGYILWFDADWTAPAGLERQIRTAVRDGGEFAAWRLSLTTYFCGHRLSHGRAARQWRVRLQRAGTTLWTGSVHEQPLVSGPIGSLDVGIEHHHVEALDERFSKILAYARLRAGELRAQGYKFRLRDLVWVPLRRTLGNLIVGCGFRDGVPGLLYWCLRGIESFCTLALVWAEERTEGPTAQVGSLDEACA